jgi:1-phosphofructokinase
MGPGPRNGPVPTPAEGAEWHRQPRAAWIAGVRTTLAVTLTPNPSLDLTYRLAAGVSPDEEVQRALETTLEPSGKGVNVALALHRAGAEAVAVLPLAGATGRQIVELLDDAGLPHRTLPQPGQARVNTTVLREGAPTTKYNAPGPALTHDALRDLLGALLERCVDALLAGPAEERWLVLCGSLPPQLGGAGEDLARGLAQQAVAVAHTVGARCAVDVSGAALAGAIRSGADLLAPNVAELAEVDAEVRAALTARSDGGPERPTAALPAELLEAVRRLSARTGSQLLVSAGAAGALWTDGIDLLHAAGPPLRPVNTAGAGDALLAGWLVDVAEPAERLQRAVRWGRSACLAATTVDPAPGAGDSAEVTVRRL